MPAAVSVTTQTRQPVTGRLLSRNVRPVSISSSS
jgi:hypothetical protein